MMSRYVLDTNIISALLRYENKIVKYTAQNAALNAEFLLCPIVFYETLRGLLHRDAKKQLQRFLNYAATLTWDDFNQADWEKAAESWAALRGQGLQVGDADLLIGVYALQRQAIVVTANEKHFIPLGVQTENWLA